MTTRRRPAFALIELLVVLTVTVIMLTLAAGMIHLLLKLDRSSRAASDLASDMARLSRDFRADAHASAPIGGLKLADHRAMFTVVGDRTVEYQVRDGDILRTAREGDKVRHHEVYRRPIKATVRFAEIDNDGPRHYAMLAIDLPTDDRDGSLYRDYQIRAELGKDHRLNPRAE